MATICNMGDVYWILRIHSRLANLTPEQSSWFELNFVREVASRPDWTCRVPTTVEDGWWWLNSLTDVERQRYEAIKVSAARAVAEAMVGNEEVVVFIANCQERSETFAVANWLAALRNEDPLLFSQLAKVSWRQAVEHSIIWRERAVQRMIEAITPEELASGAEVVIEFGDGWHWVRLTTTTALDCEGLALDHHVGEGEFDHLAEAKAPNGIYSLRDPSGYPHATVFVENGEAARLTSITGGKAHADRFLELIRKLDVIVDPTFSGLGLAIIAKRLMSVDEALDILASGPVDGDVYLGGSDVTTLPPGTSISGRLSLTDCFSLMSLPEGLKVGFGLNLGNCISLKQLPNGLAVGGPLDLHNCISLTDLPSGMLVDEMLILTGCVSLVSLPADMVVKGKIYGLHPGIAVR